MIDQSSDSEKRRGRQWLVGGLAASISLVLAVFLGAHVGWLAKLAVLPSRRSDIAIQGLPVQTKAAFAGVVEAATSPAYRLRIFGKAVPHAIEFSIDELRGHAKRRAALPIACVQGWSVSATWEGVPVRDLLATAGVRDFSEVIVTSIQKRTKPAAMFTSARLNRAHALDPGTLIALKLNGETLDLDHGYPARLIAPNNPGILQTKWVESMEVK
jgi:DMSO/TMAO reductase YedYZ molybdopterin-dependent catalytic subunit